MKLHGTDENNFSAKLEPDGAGLTFEVDFFGKGSNSPQALHSEGHQDSMGICLYLALTEKLNRRMVNFVVLDDVVMSVDVDHRKEICGLLSECFPDKQFIITTHDKTWAQQLKSEKIVSSKQLIEFHNWDLNSGPQTNLDEIVWDSISNKLAKDNIHDAASELRRELEAFFSEACNNLGGFVKYKSNQRWELGDWCPAATTKYLDLLKTAIKSATSWGKEKDLTKLSEQLKVAGKIIQDSQMEQWAINAAVHYNNWENLNRKEFTTVVDSFGELTSLFACDKCGVLIEVLYSEYEPVRVCCPCGNMDWNLTMKSK
jgi:hypothetical protein